MTEKNINISFNGLVARHQSQTEICEKKAKEINSWGTKKPVNLSFLKKKS